MNTTPTGRPTPAGIGWATAGPDRWEWRGYVVTRSYLCGCAFYAPSVGAIIPGTLEAAQAICEEHYQKTQTNGKING